MRDLAAVERQDVLQGLLDQLELDRLVAKAGEVHDPLQGAFQFAHVLADVLGHEVGDFFRQLDAALLGLAQQDGHPHL